MTHLDTKKYNRRLCSVKIGDVCWAENLPFDGVTGCKSRPVVVTGFSDGEVRYRNCTSQQSTVRDRRAIADPYGAGLMKRTYVDMEEHTVPIRRIKRCLGHLSPEDEDWVCS